MSTSPNTSTIIFAATENTIQVVPIENGYIGLALINPNIGLVIDRLELLLPETTITVYTDKPLGRYIDWLKLTGPSGLEPAGAVNIYDNDFQEPPGTGFRVDITNSVLALKAKMTTRLRYRLLRTYRDMQNNRETIPIPLTDWQDVELAENEILVLVGAIPENNSDIEIHTIAEVEIVSGDLRVANKSIDNLDKSKIAECTVNMQYSITGITESTQTTLKCAAIAVKVQTAPESSVKIVSIAPIPLQT